MIGKVDEYLGMFHEEVGEPLQSRAVPASAFESYKGRLPDSLLEIWRRDGWCGYGKGIFWTVNPDEYSSIINAWLKETPLEGIDNFHVYGRSAFGNLYVWCEKARDVIELVCVSNGVVAFKKSFEAGGGKDSFDFLSGFALSDLDDFDLNDDSGDEESFLFESALQRLGALSSGEIYGFVPALILGGSPNVNGLKKVRIHAHLMMLRDFAMPETPYWDFDISEYDID